MSVTQQCQQEERVKFGKPKYQISFFQNGNPKICEGPTYFYIFVNGEFRATGKNFGIMAKN